MIFFSVFESYFTHGHEKCYFHSSHGYAVYENGIFTTRKNTAFGD